MLLHKLTVKDRQLTAPSGMSYRVLVLDPRARQMSLPVLRKLQELAREGVIIVGDKPSATPSLADDEKQFTAIADELWSSPKDGPIYNLADLRSVLDDRKIAPDFEYTRPQKDTRILFVHRTMPGTDIYFLNNRNDLAESVDAVFRVTGRAPELWHADTGRTEGASYRIAEGRTIVPLTLDPEGTVFVVFRKPTETKRRTLPAPTETRIATITTPWKLDFEPNRGAPATINLDALASWSDNADPGVKYFSGHCTYTTTLRAPAAWFKPGARLALDLGDVANLAEVKINHQPLGIVWKKPYRVDVSKALHPGTNTVEITVTNLWVNRLIGDAQPDASRKYTFTTRNPYKANSRLLPSGLLGPVAIIQTAVSKDGFSEVTRGSLSKQ